MIYNIIFIFLLGLSLIELYMYNNRIVVRPKIDIGILISIFLVFFAGGRINTGLDYAGYERYFYMIKGGSLKLWNSIVEPSYVLLGKIVPSYRVLLFIMAIGCVVIKYIAFRKLNVQLMAFVMFFYFSSFFLYYDMGIMRQGLAMGISLLAIPYAEEKDKRFFVLVIIATLFHIGSLMFILIYFVADKEFSRTSYYGLMVVAIVLAILASTNIVQNSIISKLIGAVGGGYINYKYDRYFSSETANYLITILKRVFVGTVFVEWFKRIAKKNEDNSKVAWTYINGYILSIPLFSVVSLIGFTALAGRITAVLYMLYWLVYEKILKTKRHRMIKIGLLIIFVLLSYSTLNDIVTSSSGDLYRNYTFFID